MVSWCRSDDGTMTDGYLPTSPPTTWVVLRIAFERNYLTTDVLSRAVETLVTITQEDNENASVYTSRVRESWDRLNRLRDAYKRGFS